MSMKIRTMIMCALMIKQVFSLKIKDMEGLYTDIKCNGNQLMLLTHLGSWVNIPCATGKMCMKNGDYIGCMSTVNTVPHPTKTSTITITLSDSGPLPTSTISTADGQIPGNNTSVNVSGTEQKAESETEPEMEPEAEEDEPIEGEDTPENALAETPVSPAESENTPEVAEIAETQMGTPTTLTPVAQTQSPADNSNDIVIEYHDTKPGSISQPAGQPTEKNPQAQQQASPLGNSQSQIKTPPTTLATPNTTGMNAQEDTKDKHKGILGSIPFLSGWNKEGLSSIKKLPIPASVEPINKGRLHAQMTSFAVPAKKPANKQTSKTPTTAPKAAAKKPAVAKKPAASKTAAKKTTAKKQAPKTPKAAANSITEKIESVIPGKDKKNTPAKSTPQKAASKPAVSSTPKSSIKNVLPNLLGKKGTTTSQRTPSPTGTPAKKAKTGNASAAPAKSQAPAKTSKPATDASKAAQTPKPAVSSTPATSSASTGNASTSNASQKDQTSQAGAQSTSGQSAAQGSSANPSTANVQSSSPTSTPTSTSQATPSASASATGKLTIDLINSTLTACGQSATAYKKDFVEELINQINKENWSTNEQSMFLANIYHESGGLSKLVEAACVSTPCTNYDKQATLSGAPGKHYFGRGYIQLTWPANYKEASQAIYKDDRLYQNPDQIATDKSVAAATAIWFWKTKVASQPNYLKQFGVTIKAINGSIECGASATNKAAPQNRWDNYTKIAGILGVKDKASNTGC
ncbi:hypothetical protein NEOKW01_0812 [Nematocida sp. AWRm80]|nr:hypothetical protein NEOKW01_0812 [Nematocida sp. AWRm80]